MEKPRKRGPRVPVRKKRLQLDSDTQPTSQSTEESKSTNLSVSHDETSAKESDTTASSSTQPADSNTDTTSRPKSASPEPNCAICLGKLENKSFTDSCFHTFCFVCLEEWSKVKPECPLCKQKFKSIIHNVRSLDDYDQHQVGQPNERIELSYAYPHGERFRYRTTITDHRYAFAQIWERERERQNLLLQRPSRYTPVPNWRRLRQPASSEFRRSIYEQRLRIKEDQVNTRRRIRETSPAFFRENPAQTHRLVPWLNRELNALLADHGTQVAFVLELIMGLIKRFQIGSDEFYEHLYPFIGRRTRQFMDEFLHFARSPQQMAAYDRQVEYEHQERALHHDSGSDSDTNRNDPNRTDDGNDSDVIVVSPSSTSPQSGPELYPGAPILHSNLDPWERSLLRAQDPSYLGFPPIVRSTAHDDLTNVIDFHDQASRRNAPCTSEWDEPTPSVSSFIACGDNTFTGTIRTSRHSSSLIMDDLMRTIFGQPAPSTSAPPTVSNSQTEPISFTDSDNESTASDIMIVDYEKPWTERSPIKLSSAEESDFELMIVGTSYPTDPVKKESKKRSRKPSNKDGTENGGKRKNSEENDRVQTGRQHKKRRRKSRSRSRSLPTSYLPQPHHSDVDRARQRSCSRSPIRMRFSNYSNYLHKKYHYHHPRGSARKVKSYHSRSGSSTDTGTDDEAHVSIRSRKEKSRSGHSSIEIVEYRKKRSKYKKGKKHSKGRSSDRDRHNEDTVIKARKHKKDKNDDKHKHSKKKSKHKKQKRPKKCETRSAQDRDKNKSPNNLLYGESGDDTDLRNSWEKNTSTKGLNKRGSTIGTSDSDVDSTSDNEVTNYDSVTPEHVIGGSPTNHTETTMNDEPVPASDVAEPFTSGELNSLPFQLVELSPFESLQFEKELESITKGLPLTQGDSDSGVRNRDHILTKSFKKHPHGHKKSSQKRAGEVTANPMMYSTITSPAHKMWGNLEESNIQSNDITSCTDIEKDFSLQSAKEDSSLEDVSHCRTSADGRPRLGLQSFGSTQIKNSLLGKVYESPTSSGYPNLDIVDVETLSDDSDIDVTHIDDNPSEGKAIDVEKLSDSETDHDSDMVAVNHAEREQNEELIDVVGSSEEEFDVDKSDEGRQALQSGERVVKRCSNGRFPSNESNCTIPFQEEVHEDVDITGNSDSNDTEHLQVTANRSSPHNTGVSDQKDNKDETKIEHILPSGSVRHIKDDISVSTSNFISGVNSHLIDGNWTKCQSHIASCNQNELSDGKYLVAEESTVEDAHQMVENSSLSCTDNIVTLDRSDSNCKLNGNIDSEHRNVFKTLPDRDIKNVGEAESAPSDRCKSPSSASDTDHVSQFNTEKETKDAEFDSHDSAGYIAESSTLNLSIGESNTSIQPKVNLTTHLDVNQPQDNPDLSINWTSNQILDSGTSNIESNSFLESLSTSISERRQYASPPYIATLYDNRNSESLISPDLAYESVRQNSPGQLSPASTVSDNMPDNFVPED